MKESNEAEAIYVQALETCYILKFKWPKGLQEVPTNSQCLTESKREALIDIQMTDGKFSLPFLLFFEKWVLMAWHRARTRCVMRSLSLHSPKTPIMTFKEIIHHQKCLFI